MTLPRWKFLGLLVCSAIGLLGTDARGGYTFQQVQAPGSADTEFYGINNSGLISGYFADSGGTYHGLLDRNGTLTTVDVPGYLNASATYLYAGNDSGTVAGAYVDANGLAHGLLYNSNSSTFTLLPDPDANSMGSYAGSVTNSGLVFGNYANNLNFVDNHGWVFQGGAYTIFDAPAADPNGFGTITQAANNAGTLVGYYQNTSGYYDGFIRASNGAITTIDVPGALSTSLFGINDAGVMVGQYLAADYTAHGFLLAKGVVTTLDGPEYSRTQLTAIGDNGVILGLTYPDPVNGPFAAFIATPNAVPEPSSILLMGGMAAIGLATQVWRRPRMIA